MVHWGTVPLREDVHLQGPEGGQLRMHIMSAVVVFTAHTRYSTLLLWRPEALQGTFL